MFIASEMFTTRQCKASPRVLLSNLLKLKPSICKGHNRVYQQAVAGQLNKTGRREERKTKNSQKWRWWGNLTGGRWRGATVMMARTAQLSIQIQFLIQYFVPGPNHVLGQFGGRRVGCKCVSALLDAASPAGPPTHPYKNKTAAYYSILALI